jgi:hypothetical protein
VFIGYSKKHLCYKCIDIKSGRIYIACHVIFNESSFPFAECREKSTTPTESSSYVSLPIPPIVSRDPTNIVAPFSPPASNNAEFEFPTTKILDPIVSNFVENLAYLS